MLTVVVNSMSGSVVSIRCFVLENFSNSEAGLNSIIENSYAAR
jgi:hypothetical protein